MGSFSIWHWLIVIAYLVVVLVPAATILRKAGFSGWWSLVLLVPPLNLVGLWIFAFSRWKVAPGPSAAA